MVEDSNNVKRTSPLTDVELITLLRAEAIMTRRGMDGAMKEFLALRARNIAALNVLAELAAGRVA